MSFGEAFGYAGSGAQIGTAIAPGVGTIAGAGLGFLGGLLSSGGEDLVQKRMNDAIAALNNLEIPDIDKAIALQQFQQSGTFSPELMEKIQLEADKKTALTEDPANRAKQQLALNALQELSQTGMSAIDRAQMAEMRSQVAQDLEAKRAQILQEAQMRGQAGGGQQLAAQLSASQAGAQQASKDAMQQAAAAAQARQQALSGFAGLAGQVRSADVGTQQFNIQNELARQRFLDQNSLARQQANIAAANQARMMNLQRQQQIADMNTQQYNQELARQKEAEYKKSLLDLERRKAIAGIYGSDESLKQARSSMESRATGIASILEGAGKIATAGKEAGWWGQGGGVQSFDVPSAEDSFKMPEFGSRQKKQFSLFSHGGRIDGQANVDGDSYQNDTVEALLSPGEIVVPRTKAKDPKKAKSFIDEVFEQEKLDKKQKKGYDKNESLLDLIAKLHSEKSK